MIKDYIKSILPNYLFNILRHYRSSNLSRLGFFGQKTYSQSGEDIILQHLFCEKKSGFYVDVGSNHPMRLSNTYILYKKGFRGINIDATPGSMKLFRKIRPKDINLEIPISDKEMELPYYMFNDSALNTFDDSWAKDWINNSKYCNRGIKLLKTEKLKTATLTEVLDKYLPKNTQIDCLSVDVEGFDISVLKSLNFFKYKPKIIIVELFIESFEEIFNEEIYKYLKNYNYNVFAKTYLNVFFILNETLINK